MLALSGDLGAGKSVLARAVAHGAGVQGHMPSPTFNLVYRYDTPAGPVMHLDLYRLNRADEVWELGWRELGENDDIVLIEWPERAAELLPRDRWDVRLEAVEGEPLLRRVSAHAVGAPPALEPPEAP